MNYNKLNAEKLGPITTRLNNKLETYIYGAGITASKVFIYLKNLGVNISGFVVDKKKVGLLHGLSIFEFSQMEKSSINMILGYVPSKDTVQDIQNRVVSKIKFVNFIAYDFSFLSFGLFKKNYISSKAFSWVIDTLEDKYSIDTLIAYVKSRNTGNYKICEKFYEPNQYFPTEIISLNKNEIFVDCGVFDGETIKEFVAKTENTFDFIYGFEPDKKNYQNSNKNLENISPNKLALFNLGSWINKDILKFNSISDRVSEIDPDGAVEINVDSIDNLVCNKKLSFIKMDVEGAELNSLKGAIKNIKLYKPKLAICLYHKPEDIHDIIYWIRGLNLSYKFYIRLHTRFSQELVLYCI